METRGSGPAEGILQACGTVDKRSLGKGNPQILSFRSAHCDSHGLLPDHMAIYGKQTFQEIISKKRVTILPNT